MHPIDAANQEALGRMTGARPLLVGVARAGDVIPGMRSDLLLHAGPPIAWERMSGPLRGALIGGCLFEGLAATAEEAETRLAAGEVAFDSCHHHATVGPMAGVTTASMAVYVVENGSRLGQLAYSNLNEGYGKVLRYGAYDAEVLAKLRWMHGEMADVLRSALRDLGPLDIRALLAEALHMGDEGHNRNKAGSLLFLKALAPHVARVADGATAAHVLTFLGANALSVLNPVMAACKVMADAAHGVPHSTLITAMARNGTDFGIRISGLGERWFTGPSAIPDGLYFPGYSVADANPDIGDSTITETAGIGAFAMASAPAIVSFIGGSPGDALAATLEMYEITVGEHPHFTIPPLGFRGSPVGIDLRRVVELGVTPRVNTGIAHRLAGVGQIGAGLVRPPLEPFVAALEAFVETFGY
jgi:hypothetical protein